MYFIFVRLICLAVGYLFGMFETAYFVGKAYGVDIRQKGSGNTGTTNTLRVLGKKAGLLVFLGDIFKTIFAVIICYFIFREQFPDKIYLVKLYAGFGSILGHNFPFYLKFKGGKGIACMGACMLIYDWKLVAIALPTFLAILIITRYMSLASLTASVIFPVYVAIASKGNIHMIIVTALFTVSAFYNHRQNIVRLIHGNENKMTIKKKDPNDKSEEKQ
jgi:glycerol-3-phosphate acyltransferase PlsY